MKRHIGLGTILALTSTCIAGVGCRDFEENTGEAAAVSVDAKSTLPTSATSLARVNEIRTRFQFAATDEGLLSNPKLRGVAPALLQSRPVIGAALPTRFTPSPGALRSTHVRAELPAEQLAGVAHAAHVNLPRHSTDTVVVEDKASHVRVGFALRNAKNAEATQAGGYTIYPGAAEGADVVHRVHAQGTEDFIVFEKKPAVAALAYDVDITNVAALRLVGDTLEFLNGEGSPSLRIDPPYVVDAAGKRHAASLAVEGCAYDTNTAPPWGRALTPPGASSCTVRVAWGDVAYPAIVDPSWAATGSMQTRWMQQASLLSSGKVLVSGGYDTNSWDIRSSAEIYNPSTGTFAATGSMADALVGHTLILLSSGQVLVAGGDPYYGMGSTPLNHVELFNESTGTFSSTTSMSAQRRFHSATLLSSGKVLIVGGRVFATGPEAEIFDPSTNTFSSPSMPTLGSDEGVHTATLLASGKVLLTSGTSTAAKIYDPTAGTFTATGAQKKARSDGTAVRLASGKVLIFGGNDPNGSPVTTAEIFDPAGAGTFTLSKNLLFTGVTEGSLLPSGLVLLVGGGAATQLFNPAANRGVGGFSSGLSMGHDRYNPTVTPLSNGKLLVAGGDAWSGEAQSTAELYTP